MKIKGLWLPEIFQIGLRNPQGLEYSPIHKNIYITNHGAKGGDWFGVLKKKVKIMVGKYWVGEVKTI